MLKHLKAQLAAVLATIAAKQKSMGTIMTKAHDEKRTPNETEETEIQAIEGDLEKLEKNANRLRGLIKATEEAESTLTPIAGENPEQAGASADGEKEPEKAGKPVQVKSNLEKGIGFAKAIRAKVASQVELRKGNYLSAVDIAKSRNEPEQVIQYLEKAGYASTTDPTTKPLTEPDVLDSEFIELLRANTIFDKLTGFRDVPFNTSMANQLTGATASWTGEGKKKKTTIGTFGKVKIGEHKVTGITVFTDEFLRNSKPKSDQIFLQDLIAAISELIDTTFIGKDAGDDETPAGILYGVSPIVATDMTLAGTTADLEKLVAQFLANNHTLAGANFIMSEVRAFQFSKIVNALGAKYYDAMGAPINAKALEGINVIESEHAGNELILLKPSEILLADDEQVDVSYSNEATIEMADGTTVNLWQQNMSAVRCERFISWEKRRATAVSYLQYA